MPSAYTKKAILCGDIIEFYEYENPILEGYSDTKKKPGEKGRSVSASEEDKELNRQKTISRAKRDVRRLINTNINPHSKFITLTFADNLTNIKKANYEFKKFRERLEYYLKYKLQYVAVVEFQKRGAVHYHLVMFNAPYIKNKALNELWGNGFVKINKIDNVDNVGAYVCKYMTKDNDDERLHGEKMYFTSRSLEKPYEIKEKEDVERLGTSMPSEALVYENTFSNEHNSIIYKQYNIKRVKVEEVV